MTIATPSSSFSAANQPASGGRKRRKVQKRRLTLELDADRVRLRGCSAPRGPEGRICATFSAPEIRWLQDALALAIDSLDAPGREPGR